MEVIMSADRHPSPPHYSLQPGGKRQCGAGSHNPQACPDVKCNNTSWFSQLTWVLLGFRTPPNEGLDVFQVEMVFRDLVSVVAQAAALAYM
ncbi:hypothetical protein Pcinc_003262 [Petrolisthes cinctipes]|uniref:Uncharacterized protein n=1 Tax=Petrolisthes cinctipes TaxID=88211 RepID=A0AAE1L1B9_PETCI|nr:hypothetical protein Pcinc_003262 [Petrolisthes cinctipes]